MIYLDYSANTPADPAVLAAFCQTEQTYIGNPNSTHCAGRAAQSELQRITDSIAGLLGVEPAEIIYTSGASESNNLAIKGIAQAYRKGERHENRQHHAHPELSLQETGTTDKIRQILKKELKSSPRSFLSA